MYTKPARPSQRITTIFLLCSLLLQSCYQGHLITPQTPKLENNHVAMESYATEDIEAKDLDESQPKEGAGAVSEEDLPHTQALVLATEPTPLSSFIPDAKQIKSNEAPKTTPVGEQRLGRIKNRTAQNRTKFGRSLPSYINNIPKLRLNTQATVKHKGSFRNSSNLKLASVRDQQLAHRQNRAAQSRTKSGLNLSAIIDQANVLNTPLNWKSREGHILLELYTAQGSLYAKVVDKASSQLTYVLPVSVFPGISLGELASYSAIKLQQYLHIQIGKAPALGQVIFSQSGLSGGGVDQEEEVDDLCNQEIKNEQKEEKELDLQKEVTHPKVWATLWDLGQNSEQQHYLTAALATLEEQAHQGENIASYSLLKKLSSLGSLMQCSQTEQPILPPSWQGKSIEELQKITTEYYEQSLTKLRLAQTALPASDQVKNTLRILKLQYYYYQFLGSSWPDSSALLASLKKGLGELGLQELPKSRRLERAYLKYLVKKVGQMDLQNKPEDLRAYIKHVTKKIAKKAIKFSGFGENAKESKALRQLTARHYRKLGDLIERFKFKQGDDNNTEKSDEWQPHSYYLQANELEDSIATYRLSLLYEQSGSSDEKQFKAAHDGFEKSAQQGYSLAQHRLALYYEKEKNSELATIWHEHAASQGHPESLYALYKQASEDGKAKGIDPSSSAVTYLVQAAQVGHRDAQYTLGQYYWTQKQYDQAIKYFKKAACHRIPGAYAFLGLASAKGLGTIKNLTLASEYYTKADLGEGNAMARYGKGRLYEKGQGVPEQNPALALNLYTEASSLGYHKAAYHAGRMHLVGEVVGSEPKQAYNFLKQAAEHNIYKASLLLGRMHEYGWGRKVDLGLALHWYKQAASNANKDKRTLAQALYQLGWLYRLGKGFDSDETAALGFFEQAAIAGQDKYVQLQADNEGLAKQLQGFQEKLKRSTEVMEEKESAYKKLQEEKVAQEAAYKKLQEKSKVKLAQQETAYKKLQEEKLAQEAAYKKLQEKVIYMTKNK